MTTLPKARPNALLAALPPEDRRALAPHLETVRLRRGTVLLEAGAPIVHAFFPHDCVISLTALTADGGVAETATIGREGMVGFVAALGDDRALNRAVVQLEGDASRLPRARLEAALAASPALRGLLLRYVNALMGQALQTVACNALHAVEARLARWVLMLHDRNGGDTLALTQEFLAEMLGVQRTTVTLVARTLQGAGLIKYRRGLVRVLDRPGLEEASCDCYRTIRGHFDRLLPGTFG
jgi:CRP-like cAMP-binding protein